MGQNENSVVITRMFHAGIERLWKAFTDVEDILMWHSPVGMTNPHASVDLRVGGAYSIAMRYDDSGETVTVRGVYREINKPHKLVYTWKWDGSEEETEVTVEFQKVTDEKTRVVLTHRGFSDHPSEVDLKNNWTRESHNAGWTTAFEKLQTLYS